jgi:flagellar L-ring protein FlgH
VSTRARSGALGSCSGLPLFCGLLLLLGGCAAPAFKPERFEPTSPPAPEATHSSNGSIWAGSQSIALFEDTKARRVGDVLTILLLEKTDASKKASVNTSKDSEVDIGNPTLFGRPFSIGGTAAGAFGIESSQSFSGSGDAVQGNKLEGSVSVVVAQVLANGNLVVRGEKNIELTTGTERVAISGIVRPADISPANTVSSDRVADARISYAGRGDVANSGKPGWLTRFFNSAWMPF